MFLCTDEYIYIYQCKQIISFWLLWLIEYKFKINLSDSLSLLRKYMCYALRYLYRLKSKCYYNFKSMKQLWWKIKMYLFTLLSTWLTPKNSIITLHKFKVITPIYCLWPIEQVHLQISGLLRWLSGKELSANAGDAGDVGSVPWVEKITWSWKWQPTPWFLPGKSHEQRGLMVYSLHGGKELDTTKHVLSHINTHTHTLTDFILNESTHADDWSLMARKVEGECWRANHTFHFFPK